MARLDELLLLAIFGGLTLLAKQLLKSSGLNTQKLSSTIGGLLMSIPKPIMMILMSIPEQIVLALLQPQKPLLSRLLVSISMYVIHFSWNGIKMKPQKSHNELVWIIGTALFALHALEVDIKTVVALIAADSVMTLSMRGLA